MPNLSLSYTDYVGFVPNSNSSLKCAIISVHANIFSHSRKYINSLQSIATMGIKREKDCKIITSCRLRSNEQVKLSVSFSPL